LNIDGRIESYQYIFDADKLFDEEISEEAITAAVTWKLSCSVNSMYGGNPPDGLMNKLGAELTSIHSEDAMRKVAILYELCSWLRENKFSYSFKHPYDALFYLDISTEETETKISESINNISERFEYVIDVSPEAFALLGKLFQYHWITEIDDEEGFYYHLDGEMHPVYGQIAGIFMYPQNRISVQ